MKGRRTFVALLSLASLCAAQAAAAQTARVSRPVAAGTEAAPPAKWSDVRVEFEGARIFTAEQLSGAATACYERGRKADAEFDLDLLDNCLQTDVRRMLMRAGYVRAVVGYPRAEPWGLSQRVTVSVEENEFYRLGRVSVEGVGFFKSEGLRELLPLKRGDVADATAVTRWLDEHVKRMYADEGFIQYEFEVQPEFKAEAGAAEGVVDLAVTIHEGKRFKLRRLEFEGGENLPEDLLRGAMRLKEGEVFSAQGFRDAVARLNGLDLPGVFDIVDGDRDVKFEADEETAQLDIKIRLTERGREPARVGEGRPGEPTLKRRQ